MYEDEIFPHVNATMIAFMSDEDVRRLRSRARALASMEDVSTRGARERLLASVEWESAIRCIEIPIDVPPTIRLARRERDERLTRFHRALAAMHADAIRATVWHLDYRGLLRAATIALNEGYRKWRVLALVAIADRLDHLAYHPTVVAVRLRARHRLVIETELPDDLIFDDIVDTISHPAVQGAGGTDHPASGFLRLLTTLVRRRKRETNG